MSENILKLQSLCLYIAKLNKDVVSFKTFKMKEKDYFKKMLDQEYLEQFSPKQQKDPEDFIAKNTAKEILEKMREEEKLKEGNSEESLPLRFGFKDNLADHLF